MIENPAREITVEIVDYDLLCKRRERNIKFIVAYSKVTEFITVIRIFSYFRQATEKSYQDFEGEKYNNK